MARLTLLLVGCAVIFGGYLRLVPADSALLIGDELHTLRRLANGYGYLIANYSNTGAGLVLPLLQRIGVDLVGLNHWSMRAPAVFGGMALLVCLYPIGRKIVGNGAALVATLLVAACSPLIYYTHFARSYSLMIWISLVLLYLLQRIVDAEAPAARKHYLLSGLCVALLPAIHLTSLAWVGGVCGATLLALWLQARRRDAVALAIASTAGLAIALLLHAPAWETLEAFVSEKVNPGEFSDAGVWDVGGLLLGSRIGAFLAAALWCLAAIRIGMRLRSRALPLLAACITPVLALVVVEPFGDVYAWARYCLVSLPFVALTIGWLVADLLGTETGSLRPSSNGPTAVAGVVLSIALYLSGPYGVRHVEDGPHANTYLSLFSLPEFDLPWDETPAFYSQLANRGEGLRIIESPALYNRVRQLYRNYYLQHGAETWLGVWPGEFKLIPEGPYVSLDDPNWRVRAQADYLILHLDIRQEAIDYWSFVFDISAPGEWSSSVATYMESFRRMRKVRPTREKAALRELALVEQLGPAIYRDDRIAVWDCR